MREINWTPASGNEISLRIGAFRDIDEFALDLRKDSGEPRVCTNITRDAARELCNALHEFLDDEETDERQKEARRQHDSVLTHPYSETRLSNVDTQIVGLPEQNYCLTPQELRIMADASEKVEALDAEGDQTFTLKINDLPYRITFGWDETGSFGVLAAWMTEDS